MRNLFFRSTILFFLIFSSTYAVLAGEEASKKGLLDGMVFIGHVGPKGKKANGQDEVVFQNGTFLSTSCSKYGFLLAPYSAEQQGDAIVFTAVTHSPRNGQIDWQGRVKGDTLEATYLWTKDRWYWFDAHEENWLTAQLKKD